MFFLFFLFLTQGFCLSHEEWQTHVKHRPSYKEKEAYRIFNETSPEHVKQFYISNHAQQTIDFVRQKKEEYLSLAKGKRSIWEVLECLDTLVDQSDPDLGLAQSEHAFQTAEALRRDGHPRWLILTGLIHDLGKILSFYGEPQWAVVGDTFPVGCAWGQEVVFPEYFKSNPDSENLHYKTKYGIYTPQCGFDTLEMSWGHDEYLYYVVKNYLPEEALYIIRYHSFYAAHREGGYSYFMDEKDQKMLPWLKMFSEYDLYSKSEEKIEKHVLMPYYKALVAEFFPEKIDW